MVHLAIKINKMKNILIIFVFIFCSIKKTNAQKINIDSTINLNQVEKIRKNVTDFFEKQNKRFNEKILGLNEEFIIYFKPNYSESGFLQNDIYHLDEQLKGKYDYEIENCTGLNLLIPQKLVDYSNFLLNRSNGNWCENKFGYKNLKKDDELGILFIYSPKNIPDSLSVLKLKEFSTSDYELQSKEKKRVIDLALLQSRYIKKAEGLNERFIRVVLKY
jgi:hypothetical protein